MAVALLVVTAACGTSGRNMASPVPGATAPPRRPDPTTSTAIEQTPSTNELFTLSSTAIDTANAIGTEYTCDTVGNAPPFSWTNVPAGTVELALVIADPDAGGFIHWFVSKIDPTTTGLGPRFAPPGAVELKNSGGTTAYAPICPPPGKSHTYEFTLYALDSPSGLTAESDATQALTTLATTAIGTAVLTGVYTRNTAN